MLNGIQEENEFHFLRRAHVEVVKVLQIKNNIRQHGISETVIFIFNSHSHLIKDAGQLLHVGELLVHLVSVSSTNLDEVSKDDRGLFKLLCTQFLHWPSNTNFGFILNVPMDTRKWTGEFTYTAML